MVLFILTTFVISLCQRARGGARDRGRRGSEVRFAWARCLGRHARKYGSNAVLIATQPPRLESQLPGASHRRGDTPRSIHTCRRADTRRSGLMGTYPTPSSERDPPRAHPFFEKGCPGAIRRRGGPTSSTTRLPVDGVGRAGVAVDRSEKDLRFH